MFSAKEIGALAGNNEGRVDAVSGFSYTHDTIWHVTNFYPDYNTGNYTFYPLDISSDSAFDFEIFSTDMGVKWELEQYYFAMIKDTMGLKEVFVNDWWNSYDDLYQLSFLNTMTRNPQFFLGESAGQWGYNLYLVFEAKVDGYWQLYYSYQSISWGSIGENVIIDGVEIFPNPATNFIQIHNENGSELTIEIFDMTGRRVFQDAFNDVDNEIETGRWIRGIYFVRIIDLESNLTRKIILN